MAFGVKTANMFELLGDEEGGSAPSKPVAKPQAESKKAATPDIGGSNVEARMKGAALNGQASTNANGRGDGRGRGRGRGRGGRGGYDYREGGDAGEGGGEERGPRPYRGRGGGGRHFERDSRRGYDRHDGTGRGHETEKKGGHGGHNWGAPGEEEAPVVDGTGSGAVWQEEPASEPLAAATDAPAAAEAAGEATEAPAEPAEPEEPEKEEMTLDEYEKLQEEKRGALKKKPSNVTKVDTKAFEGMKAYNPKEAEEDDSFELSDKKLVGKSKSGVSDKVRKEKELLPTGFRVGSNEGGRGRGRGDRGGRFNDKFGDRPERPARRNDEEGGRGYGRGGGDRSDRPFSGGRGRGRGRDGPPPTISDDRAFPTLGA